jgi:hypothetical protein
MVVSLSAPFREAQVHHDPRRPIREFSKSAHDLCDLEQACSIGTISGISSQFVAPEPSRGRRATWG